MDLKFFSMKSALTCKRIFGGSSHSDSLVGGDGITVKQENVCYTKTGSSLHRSTRRSGFNRGSSSDKGHKMKNTQKGTNPKCAICGSVFHWVKDCPHKEDVHEAVCENQEATRDCNITLFARDVDPSEVLICEAFSIAVVNTTCTKTACGQQWLNIPPTLIF